MLKNIIELPDGSRISSGAGMVRSIKNCTVTDCVNSWDELTIGSVCSTCLEATTIVTSGSLGLSAGDSIKLYKVDETGVETKVGIFLLEMPTKNGSGIYQLTAYDWITKLGRDLSAWLKSYSNWGCTLREFAAAVCAACGLHLYHAQFPNEDFPVSRFYKSGVTGRQLMSWIGEIAGCFVRMSASNEVELAWYTDSGVTIHSTGGRYYFSRALTYEDYNVAPIDAVQLRLADGDDGALWPDVKADNPYIITGNAILLAKVTNALRPYLEVIRQQLAALPAYRPCKVSLPAGLDIRAGQTVQVEDAAGNRFTTCVMTKTQAGQKDTLECTGSARRDSSRAVNNRTPQELAQDAVDRQTREDVFNKLTEGGKIQGLYVQDGKWYINAELVKVLNLTANMITAGLLRSVDGAVCFDMDKGLIRNESATSAVEMSGGLIKTMDKTGRVVFQIGCPTGDHSEMIMYGPHSVVLFLQNVADRLCMSCYDEDDKVVKTYQMGFKTVNGAKVFAATDVLTTTDLPEQEET